MIYKFLILGLIFLGGCVSLLPEQGKAPDRIYIEPSLKSTKDIKGKAVNTIAVIRPTASNMLDSERLRIRYSKNNLSLIEHIADVELQEHLPLMVQRHMVKALQKSNKFKAVGFEEDSFKRDFILEMDIEHFDVVNLGNQMYTEVVFSCKFLDGKGRKALWQKTFKSTTPIKEHKLVAFVKALTLSYENVLTQISTIF